MDLLKFFRKNADGSWSCVAPVQIKTPNGQIDIGPGMSFNKGVYFMGVNLAEMLEKQAIHNS